MLESNHRRYIENKLSSFLPGCLVLKTDPTHLQGIPDFIFLYRNRWGALELKVSSKSRRQPNQEYYVDLLDKMSFAAFISPETEEEVFRDIQQTFRT